jgi:hypothetical protein
MGGSGTRPADWGARDAHAAWCSRHRSPGAAGRLRFPSPPLEAPSGRGGAGGCGGTGRRRGEHRERACPRGGGTGAAGGREPGWDRVREPESRRASWLSGAPRERGSESRLSSGKLCPERSHFGDAILVCALRVALGGNAPFLLSPISSLVLGKFSGKYSGGSQWRVCI